MSAKQFRHPPLYGSSGTGAATVTQIKNSCGKARPVGEGALSSLCGHWRMPLPPPRGMLGLVHEHCRNSSINLCQKKPTWSKLTPTLYLPVASRLGTLPSHWTKVQWWDTELETCLYSTPEGKIQGQGYCVYRLAELGEITTVF
jgi:hypothetical protein